MPKTASKAALSKSSALASKKSKDALSQERQLARAKKERKEERERVREEHRLAREKKERKAERDRLRAAHEERKAARLAKQRVAAESDDEPEHSEKGLVTYELPDEVLVDAVVTDPVPESKYTLEISFLNAAPFKNLIAKLSTIFSSCPVEFVPPSSINPNAEDVQNDEDSDDQSDQSSEEFEVDDQDLKNTNSARANEQKFIISGGIKIFSITEDKKVVVRATINADLINKFHCEKVTKIGMNIMVLNKALKIVKDSDMLCLRMRRGSDDYLYISAKDIGKSNERMAEMRMFLPSADGHPVDLCEKRYDYEITMQAGELQRVCKNMTTGSPDLQIWASKDSISFKSQNESIITASKHGDFEENICDDEYQYDEDAAQSDPSDSESRSQKVECFGSFNLKHMLIFASTAKSDVNIIRLHLAHREPLMIWTSISNIGDLYAMIVPALRTNFRQQ